MKISMAVLVVGAVSAVQAAGAKPPTRVPEITAATLRDAADDIQLTDGGGTYLSSDFSAVLRDFNPSQPDGDLTTADQDYLSWGATFESARYTRFNNALAMSHAATTAPIRCKSGRFYFVSESTPDFVEVLQTVGAAVTGWASTGCWTTDKFKYQANYQTGTDECVTLTRTSETSLTLTAPAYDPLGPASCLAWIYTFDSGVPTVLGRSSAPFQVTFDLSTGPGRGKRHGNH